MCVVIELEYVLEYDYSTIARHEFVLTCISMNCEPRITQGMEGVKALTLHFNIRYINYLYLLL